MWTGCYETCTEGHFVDVEAREGDSDEDSEVDDTVTDDGASTHNYVWIPFYTQLVLDDDFLVSTRNPGHWDSTDKGEKSCSYYHYFF